MSGSARRRPGVAATRAPSTAARVPGGGRRRPLRVGIVGTGAIAHSYLKVFDGLPGARITAVADVRAGPARAFAGALGCPAYRSALELAHEADIDAALVCTPPATHHDIAVLLLQRGIHVLCEKPLTTSTPTAIDMVEVAQRSGALLTMAAKFRFVDDVLRARSIVASGILGDIILFENVFASRVDMRHRWNSDPTMSGGGCSSTTARTRSTSCAPSSARSPT